MTAHERLDEMKKFIKIAEGSWQLPRSKEDFDALDDLLKADISNAQFQDRIYSILGDDMLFDRLDKLDPDGIEASQVTINWMKDQHTDEYSNFPAIWSTYQLTRGKSKMMRDAGEAQSKEVTDLPMSELPGGRELTEDDECNRCLGLGRHPGRAGEECPECHGSGKCPTIAEDSDEAWHGESIELGNIAESVLQEYPGQPKDYYDPDEKFETEQAERAKHMQAQTKEFEQDKIDAEIEDEELGLRFD